MQDPYFANTVTYIWKHNEGGALGIVLNKPLKASVAEIFEELDITISSQAEKFSQQKIMAGRPVEQDKGFILHTAEAKWESSVAVSEEVTLCTSRKILEDIASGNGPEKYLIALGCAGWDAGQLDKEIMENSWLTIPATSELIFSHDYAGLPNLAAAELGIDLNKLPPEAGHS